MKNLKLHPESFVYPPFIAINTSNANESLKNSPAIGTDNMSNFHKKSYSPFAIQALSNIFNYSWQHNKIPNIWILVNKIPILNHSTPPPPTACHPQYPKIVYKRIKQNIPLSSTMHGFRVKHYPLTT